MAKLYIGLGSNIAPERNLLAAVALLRDALGPMRLSPVYQTPPWGHEHQAAFLNAAAAAESSRPPLEVLDILQRIEAVLNRERTLRWGPRTIDLDLLCYGDTVLDHPRLHLPHPRLHERAFALKPLCDLSPGWLHPVLGLRASGLLEGLDQSGIERVDLELDGGD